MTKTLAVEWGPNKVRVVGIVPGGIEGTEGFERLGDFASMNNKEKANAAFANSQVSKGNNLFEIAKNTIPISRFGQVEDIANAALFLASPMASYVTGTNLLVDGGAVLTYPNFLFYEKTFVDMWSKGKL